MKGHKINCICSFCRAKRGELKGRENYFYGKHHTEEAIQKTREGNIRFKRTKQTEEHKTKRGIFRKGKNSLNYGKHHTEEWKENHSKQIGGENNPNWKGGIGRLPYSWNFNNRLKLRIRQRDKFSCQLCPVIEDKKVFPIHHIDYDRQNSNELNLVLLCGSCNSKVNFEREKWQFLFETLQEIRGI